MASRSVVFLMLPLVPACALATGSAPAADPPACAGERADTLDFWVGRWRVVDREGTLLGRNRIEKILKGCAVLEHWSEPDGSEGLSLFSFDARSQLWHQVWVTDDTRVTGGLKEKQLVSAPGARAVRFQGTLLTPANRLLLDRTTLAPLTDGRVQQTIDVSRDGGDTWTTAFDGTYLREP
jgi:hypothetical protein